jgi:alkyl hydroperoxide reductase subunit AhpF
MVAVGAGAPWRTIQVPSDAGFGRQRIENAFPPACDPTLAGSCRIVKSSDEIARTVSAGVAIVILTRQWLEVPNGATCQA